MGKWVEVKCDCSNRGPIREPIPGNSLHVVYPCGHPDGTLYQIYPGYLYQMALLVRRMFRDDPEHLRSFEVFDRISEWPKTDEFLSLSTEQAVLWQLELEELRKFHEGQREYSEKARRIWESFWRHYFDLQSNPWHAQCAGSVPQIISDGLKLCSATIESGNPIEFSW